MTFSMTFRALSAAAAFALAGLMLYAGEPNDPGWWAGALPFALWIIGPAVAPFLIAARRKSHWLSVALLSYLAVSSVLSGLAYHDAFFRSQSSTAALAMVFVPLYQWLALALLLLVGLVISAWLTRNGKVAQDR